MPSAAFHAHQARVARAEAERPAPRDLAEQRAGLEKALGRAPLAEGVREHVRSPGGVAAIELRPADRSDLPLLFYLHGGGFRMGSARTWRAYASQLAARGPVRVLLVDYRLAPEAPFPAALEDCVAAYRGVLDEGEAPGRIVVGGDSAGGGLAASLCLALRDRGLPLPAGCAALCAWLDLTLTAETYRSNAESDAMFSHVLATAAARAYLAGHDPRDPLVSPVFGDWAGMPPLLVQVGDGEVLLDDARSLVRCAHEAGGQARLDVYEGMPHVWHLACPAFPEATRAVEDVGRFVRERTGLPPQDDGA